MTFMNVILLITLIICVNVVKKALLRFHQTHALDITVRDFIDTYSKYQDVWNSDYEAERILKLCNTESNVIEIGIIDAMAFKNAKELRRCMLKAGEFIIKYSEVLQEEYGYIGDIEEYNTSLEMLREIRRICIQKGEKSTVKIKMIN